MKNLAKIDMVKKVKCQLSNTEIKNINKVFSNCGIIEFSNLPWKKDQIQNFTDYFTTKYSNDAKRREKKFKKTNINSVDIGFNEIPLHSEASFSYAYPEIIWFYCYENDEEGSPTTICDGKELWGKLEKKTKEFFLKNPVKFSLEIEIPYKDKKKSNQEMLIEQPGVSNAYINWSKGTLSFIYTKFIINIDKLTDSIFFANHLLIGPRLEKQIKNMTLIDGSNIPSDIIQEVKFKSDDLTKEYIWEKNNLLMLNNKRFMHGRKKYAKSSKREILNLQSLKINF